MSKDDLKEIEFVKEMNLISLERKVEVIKKDLAMTKLMKEVFFYE
tara:strand:+ start:481 stop:615 length:135 start_codon:yes stop_codon:yes gene_type:complete